MVEVVPVPTSPPHQADHGIAFAVGIAGLAAVGTAVAVGRPSEVKASAVVGTNHAEEALFVSQ